MNNEFNKKQMFENISYALKLFGKRIGELESETGVSTGYISRTSKDDGAKPGIDFIVKAADALNMSVDTLLNVNLSGLTETERYVINFLDKLNTDTNKGKLEWIARSEHDYNKLEADINGCVDHPLFSFESFYEEGETEYPDCVERVVFISHSFDVHTSISGNCFELRLKNGAMLYLMSISKSVYRTSDKDAFAKEVWICRQGGIKQFLGSTKGNEEISRLIENLYSAVTESAKHPRIEKGIKDVMDAFMADDLSDDPVEFPF